MLLMLAAENEKIEIGSILKKCAYIVAGLRDKYLCDLSSKAGRRTFEGVIEEIRAQY